MSEGDGLCNECHDIFPRWRLTDCSECGCPICPGCLEDHEWKCKIENEEMLEEA